MCNVIELLTSMSIVVSMIESNRKLKKKLSRSATIDYAVQESIVANSRGNSATSMLSPHYCQMKIHLNLFITLLLRSKSISVLASDRTSNRL